MRPRPHDIVSTPVTFRNVARSRPYRQLLLAFSAVAVIGLGAGGAMAVLQPVDYSGRSGHLDLEMQVRESGEGPVIVQIKHSFTVGGSIFGVPGQAIFFNISVLSAVGKTVVSYDGLLAIPLPIPDEALNSGSYESVQDYYLDLAPGQYVFRLRADEAVDYLITQKSAYHSALPAAAGIGIFGAIQAGVVIILARLKVGQLRASQWMVAQLDRLQAGPGPGPPGTPYWNRHQDAGYRMIELQLRRPANQMEVRCRWCGRLVDPYSRFCARCGRAG